MQHISTPRLCHGKDVFYAVRLGKEVNVSEVSQRLLNGTLQACGHARSSRPSQDGAVFEGTSCAARGEAFGEICFNTSLEGYLEVITDPSYAGQIITMTYPQIGNYGVNLDDCQSDEPALRGLVVREYGHHAFQLAIHDESA